MINLATTLLIHTLALVRMINQKNLDKRAGLTLFKCDKERSSVTRKRIILIRRYQHPHPIAPPDARDLALRIALDRGRDIREASAADARHALEAHARPRQRLRTREEARLRERLLFVFRVRVRVRVLALVRVPVL
jgi:hypothetical protein